MKLLSAIAFIFIVLGCQSPSPKQENTVTTNSSVVAKNDSVPSQFYVEERPQTVVSCDEKGELIEKFEQNNALFQRFKNEKKELEWLKITTKDGKCTIISDIGNANHYSVSFEDWDKDGMKDRIDNLKWDYQVSLFDKSKNDFSRHIDGRFNGDQWDFDKTQNLKYQFLENKFGGVYELYRLEGNKKKVFSEISFSNQDAANDNDMKIEIRKNIVHTRDDVKFDSLKMDAQLLADVKPKADEAYDAQLLRTQKSVEAYWKKNLSLFLK